MAAGSRASSSRLGSLRCSVVPDQPLPTLVLLARRAEQHPGFWDRELRLGHPGKVTSSLGLVPACGPWRQGWAWMRWEQRAQEQRGSWGPVLDPCCCDSVLRAEPGTSGFGAGVRAAALPPVYGCCAAKTGPTPDFLFLRTPRSVGSVTCWGSDQRRKAFAV